MLRNKNIVFIIFIAFYLFYFCSSAGVNTSNDGAHVGLAKSVYYQHQFLVEDYLDVFITEPDYAVKDGKIYSDRLPGTALLILPSFAYANLLSSLGLSTFLENEDLDIIIASLLPPLFGVLSMVMLFLFYRRYLKVSQEDAIISIVIYGLCTLSWLESSHLFSHAPSLFFVTFSVLFVVTDSIKIKRRLLIISVLLGMATLIELQNILFYFPILIYIVFKNDLLNSKKELVKSILLNAIVLSIFVFLLVVYNYTVFEDITLKTNKYNPFFPEERSFFSSLSGNFLRGLDMLYTSFLDFDLYTNPYRAMRNDIPGLFVTSPVLLFSLAGYVVFYKKHKYEFYLFLSCVLIATIVAAMHVTTLVRHIYTVNMLTFLPIVYSIQYIRELKSESKKMRLYLLFVIVIVISFIRAGFSTFSYWGRDLDNFFLYAKEVKLFFLANLPLFVFLFWKRKNIQILLK